MGRIRKGYEVRGGVDQDDWQRRAMAYERRRRMIIILATYNIRATYNNIRLVFGCYNKPNLKTFMYY